ncbi:uncharacterized protein LOC133520081 [Cydia pomonella]|uniref:uncharacterized protein LOC133520081 n=1 Tax=Cydia pomonella TaxID=82600 RepID=UPI002ADDD977|nr:uncharacterized protein LOC133520081 [Cydia pomonella]
MIKTAIHLVALMVHHNLLKPAGAVIYTYEDVELRRIFPNEFPQDTVRKTGRVDAEHLGRYAELRHYFLHPMSALNSPFEELVCYGEQGKRMCHIDVNRYSSAESAYVMSQKLESHIDRRRVVLLALIAACWAAPQQNPQEVQILRQESDNSGLGGYQFVYELSDGSKHEEQGELKNQGTENEAIAVRGQYSWVGPDGVTYVVSYIADENGFQPTIEQGPGGAVPPGVVASLLG